MISPEPDWAVALKVGVLEHVTVWVMHEVEYDQVQVDLVFAVPIFSHKSVATYGRPIIMLHCLSTWEIYPYHWSHFEYGNVTQSFDSK